MSLGSSNNDWTLIHHSDTDHGWNNISHEEAAGYYSDRILLILGPEELGYSLLLTSIPSTSSILTRLATVSPGDRHLRLPSLSSGMLQCYRQLQPLMPLATQHAWADAIKCAMAAEVLQDGVVLEHALAALERKAGLEGGKVLGEEEYGMAKMWSENMGMGKKIMSIIEQATQHGIGKDREEKKEVMIAFRSPAKEQKNAKHAKSNEATEIIASLKYPHSVLRDRGHFAIEGAGPDEKEQPLRQPSLPPSHEALRTGVVGNFEWPDPRRVA